MDCCITDLGKYPHNEDLNIGENAYQVGLHKAILFFAGVRIERPFTPAVYSPMIIPRPFNETYLYKLQIEQPDGTLYTDADGCDMFTFQIYILINSDCGTDCNA